MAKDGVGTGVEEEKKRLQFTFDCRITKQILYSLMEYTIFVF